MNTIDFINRSTVTHSDRYDYSKTVYTNKNTKVKIICREHGEFNVRPDSHYNGAECAECAKINRYEKQKANTIDFINRSTVTHSDRYDYSKTVYTSAHTKVKITCREHGEFMQSPVSHYRGSGCPECIKTTTNDFILKSKSIHGSKYVYDKSVYKGVHTHLEIECNKHGVFKLTPNEHYRGSGCKKCSLFTYDDDSETTLYILESECSKHVKVGVTHNFKRRMLELKRSTPFNFKVLNSFLLCTGSEAKRIESFFHSKFESSGFKEFDGHTEWLVNDRQMGLIISTFNPLL